MCLIPSLNAGECDPLPLRNLMKLPFDQISRTPCSAGRTRVGEQETWSLMEWLGRNILI